MQDIRGGVLQAVANPKTFLFAPFELAIVNIVIAVCFMIISIMILGWTPFLSLIPLVGGHAALTILGQRNPHLTTILQASGKYPPFRKNLSRVAKGVKYVP